MRGNENDMSLEVTVKVFSGSVTSAPFALHTHTPFTLVLISNGEVLALHVQ